MRIKNFVTAVNDNPTYYQFCDIIVQNIKKTFGQDCKVEIGYVTPQTADSKREKTLSSITKTKLFKTLPEMDSGIQAKITRLWLASESTEPTAIIDVDWLAINGNFFNQCFNNYRKGHIGTIGSNAFKGTRDEGKFPMNMVHATPDVFKKIVNPNGLPYERLLMSWNNTSIDGKESVFNKFSNFSDESLLRKLIIDTKMTGKVLRHPMPSIRPYFFSARLDRSFWDFNLKKIKEGKIIDCQPLRPVDENLGDLAPLFNYLKIDYKRKKIE